jgi:hypothetical protein
VDNEEQQFIEITKRCAKENPEAYKLITKMFAKKFISRATLFSALTDLAQKVIDNYHKKLKQ